MRKKLFSFAVVILLICSCEKRPLFDIGHHPSKPTAEPSRVATDWYRLQLQILLQRNSAFNGLYYGYIGIGLYEAVHHAQKNSISLSTKLYSMPAMPEPENSRTYNWEVVANSSMAAMTRTFFNGLTPANNASIDSLENAYNKRAKPVEASAVFNRSQVFGQSIATAIHSWFLTDKLNTTNAGYILPTPVHGSWAPTPPGFANLPVQPFLGNGPTYLTSLTSTIAPAFPVNYSEDPSSDFYKIAKEVYDVSKTLTVEQKNIASFYIDQGNGIGFTPGGHDFMALTQAIETHGTDLSTAAEAYAKAGIAERDAAIVCFRSKYQYNLLRPVTFIQKLIDPSWTPFINTPPHPEYPAAHALITGAVMQAASRVLGEDLAFTDHSYDFRGFPPRSYSSLFAAAEEAGISRLYGGIHYRPSIITGLSVAKELGNVIGNIKLHK
ncbi:vanadium-dependent haloperoxidase [Flavitalea antarctica]